MKAFGAILLVWWCDEVHSLFHKLPFKPHHIPRCNRITFLSYFFLSFSLSLLFLFFPIFFFNLCPLPPFQFHVIRGAIAISVKTGALFFFFLNFSQPRFILSLTERETKSTKLKKRKEKWIRISSTLADKKIFFRILNSELPFLNCFT